MSGRLVVELAERVLLPLTAGGELRPLPPIGEARALAALEYASHAAGALSEVRARRLRVARRLCPVDALGDPGPGEWLMLFALNDLLQSMNSTLVGTLAESRPQKLLGLAHRTAERAGAPASVGEALARHATFSRLLELVRIDTEVSWWVGRRVFRGARPPARLLKWQRVRRVSVHESRLSLGEMNAANEQAQPAFETTLRTLLAASPLTDLASAGRALLPFRWTGSTLAFVSTPSGRRLAGRALERATSPRAALAALKLLPPVITGGATPEAARATQAVAELVDEIERRWHARAEQRAG